MVFLGSKDGFAASLFKHNYNNMPHIISINIVYIESIRRDSTANS